MKLLNFDNMENSEMYIAAADRYTKEIKQLEALGFEYYGDERDSYPTWEVPMMIHNFNEDEGFVIHFPGVYDGHEDNFWHIEYDKDTEVVSEQSFNRFNDLVKYVTED